MQFCILRWQARRDRWTLGFLEPAPRPQATALRSCRKLKTGLDPCRLGLAWRSKCLARSNKSPGLGQATNKRTGPAPVLVGLSIVTPRRILGGVKSGREKVS
jgi:hypothetical protein